MIKHYISLIIFFIYFTSVYSQDNSIFYTYSEINDTNINKLFLKIETTSFLKNNEYFDYIVKEWEIPVVNGWTGIGFIGKPLLEYQPTKTTVVQAGYFFEKFSGRNDFYKPIPLFRIKQKLSKTIELVMGQLYGNLEHRLTEPMYRFDRYYSDYVEYGIQFLYKNKYLENDLWLNWEKFIFYNDPFKEEFVLGNVACFKFDFNNSIGIRLPVHYSWTHAGGQIDRNDENRGSMMSLNNARLGFKVLYRLEKKYLKKITLGYSYYNYHASANPPEGEKFHQIFDNGYGHYIKSNIDFGKIKLMLGYWKGHDYIARRGEYIFESIYEYLPTDYIHEKELLTFKFVYDYKIKKDVIFSVRSDMYYRTDTKNLLFSYAFYFIYNDSFLLKKVNPLFK